MRIDYFNVTQRAKRQYAQMAEPICRKWNLTRNELDVLLFLHNNPEYDRAADVVTHRGMVKSHVSLSVRELENKGMLLRLADPEDRRTIHLELTNAGRQAAGEGQAAQKSFFAYIFSDLSREELAAWQQITEKVCRNIEKMEEL